MDTQGWPGGVNLFFKYIFQKYFSNFFQLVIKYNRMILLKKMNEHKRGIGNKLFNGSRCIMNNCRVNQGRGFQSCKKFLVQIIKSRSFKRTGQDKIGHNRTEQTGKDRT